MIAEAKDRERMHQIAALLLANHSGTEAWGDTSTKQGANEFLICCLLDYQIDSSLAWNNGRRLVKELLGGPEDIWSAITSVSEAEWRSRRNEYRLHRFPAAHNRLWPIADRMCQRFGGDARRIWIGRQSSQVLEELLALGAGEQISRMIVGALRDGGQVQGASDVKADVYVCRVLGRALIGHRVEAATALEFARQLNPTDPWQLDWPIWNIGKSHCHNQQPECEGCYLAPYCTYAQTSTTTDIDVSEASAPTWSTVSYEEAKTRFAWALSVTT
jgi:endonuclease-3